VGKKIGKKSRVIAQGRLSGSVIQSKRETQSGRPANIRKIEKKRIAIPGTAKTHHGAGGTQHQRTGRQWNINRVKKGRE